MPTTYPTYSASRNSQFRSTTNIFLTLAVLLFGPAARGQTITTVAGSSGGWTPATNYGFNTVGMVQDSGGNFYLVSRCWLFRISPAGVVSTIAGSSNCSHSGDNGPAVNANLASPGGLALDSAGNLYITERNNSHRIRKIDAITGIITTVAGTGTGGFSGDNGPATSAQLANPFGLAFDTTGNLYVTDTSNNRVRKVDTSGIITTFAGNGTQGFGGDDGPAIAAQLSDPSGIAADLAGNLYIADTRNHRIRRVNSGGIISTFAGTGASGFNGDNQLATLARLYFPNGVSVGNGGNVYISDTSNNRIRKVAANGVITTVAGTGAQGFSGDLGPATSALLDSPHVSTFDSTGNFYFVDGANFRVRKVDSNNIITTFAGNGTQNFGGDNGPALTAQMLRTTSVASDGAGNFYVTDNDNNRIRLVSSSTGWITTIVGGTGGFGGDNGPATSALINSPDAVTLDSAGNIYFSDSSNQRVRRISTAGIITTVAGNGTAGYSGDGGLATGANLRGPRALAFDGAGNLLIADSGNHCIRRVSTSGVITTVAGTGTAGFSGDNGPAASAQLNNPRGVLADGAGNIYISDTNNQRVRKVNSSGVITTFAGIGVPAGFAGDNGPATSARLSGPRGMVMDSSGNLYIAESSGHRVRRVTPAGTISTIAGNGTLGFSGDEGLATNAQLNEPFTLALDSASHLFIADSSNNRVRRVTLPPTSTPLVTSNLVPPPNAAGWHSQPATLSWSVTDPISGIASSTGCATVTVSADTTIAGTTFTCSATNNAGISASGSVIVRMDRTAPLVSITSPPSSASYSNAQSLTFTWSASDALSGIASQSGVLDGSTVIANGQSVNLALLSPGAHTLLVNVTDIAGNVASASSTFSVLGPQSTGVSLVANPPVMTYGQSVQLSATVTPMPTGGSVTFYQGTTLLGVSPVVGGNATLQIVLPLPGTRSLRAYYSGALGYLPASSSPINVTINTRPGAGFLPGVSYPTTATAVSVAIADLNGDGLSDVITANTGFGGIITVYLGNGDGTLRARTDYPAGPYPSHVLVGDFNRDGKADIVIGNAAGLVTGVMLGNGTGQLGARYDIGMFKSYSLGVGDFNGDGKHDIAGVDPGNPWVNVALGNGDGTFGPTLQYNTGAGPHVLTIADLNSDGFADLAVAHTTSNQMSILLGNGSGTFATAVNYSLGTGGQNNNGSWGTIVADDFNGDGKLDLITPDPGVGVVNMLLGNGDGTFQPRIPLATDTYPAQVRQADLNADSIMDLVVMRADPGALATLQGNGNGTFQPRVDHAAVTYPNALAIADLNRDGVQDVILGAYFNNVTVMLGKVGPSDLTIEKSHTGNFTQGQQGAVYTLVARNIGTAASTGTVTVTENPPAGMTLVSLAGVGWNCSGNSCTRSDTLAAGSSYPPITATVNIALTAPSPLVNVATVTGGGQTNTANDSVSDSTIVLDTIKPAITVTATKADGSAYNAGTWTNQTVKVHYDCSDNVGGSGIAACTADQFFSVDGVTSLTSGTATDNAGNFTDRPFGPIQIDKSLPTIDITVPANGASYDNSSGTPLIVNWSANDAFSGVASESAKLDGVSSVVKGQQVSLLFLAPGAHTLVVTAADNAGNPPVSKSSTFTVVVTPASLGTSVQQLLAMGAISDPGTANSLLAKLGGNVTSNNINAFLNELDAQLNKKINQQAYDILRAAALSLLASL